LRKVNLPLLIGLIIIILIVLIMAFPKLFTDVNPYGIRHLKTWTDEAGKFHLEGAPFPPSKTSPLGTDEIGRDILSLIIYGTRLTITLALLIVISRFIVALPIGISAGFGSFIAKAFINQFSIIFSAIPSLLISIILLKMDFFMNLYKGHSIIAFVLVLTFVGWGKLGIIIMERVQEILAKPFIKGEIAIGKSRFQIALQNVIPHLAAELVVLFFMEIARALTIIMQLGIFGVFVGNLRVIEDTTNGVIVYRNISYEPEWASMLSTARNQIRSAPWTVLFPAIAFFVSVLGFNLFGEGLRKMLQENNSQFIPRIRRLLSFNSTIYLKRETKNSQFPKRTIATILIIIIIFTSLYLSKDVYDFNSANASAVFNTVSYGQAIIGTEESEILANNLVDTLKGMGLEPLQGDSYIIEYETEDIYVPTHIDFNVSFDSETRKLLDGVNFSLLSFGDLNLQGKIYDGTRDDLLSLKDFEKYDDKFVIIDKSFYIDEAVDYFIDRILTNSKAKGVFTILRDDEDLPHSIGKNIYNGVAIAITKETAELLLNNPQGIIDISITSKETNSIGRNIIAYIPGKDEQVGEEALVFGFSYNFLDENIGTKKIYFALELINKLINQEENRNRTLIFAFWDGTLKDEYSGVNHFAKDILYPPKKVVLYLDLTKIYTDETNHIVYNSDQAPISRYFAFSFSHQIEEKFNKENIRVKKYQALKELDELLYLKHGIATLIFSMKPKDENIKARAITLDDLGEILTETIIKNNY